jgi:uncharacterized protein (TIGR02001 family)
MAELFTLLKDNKRGVQMKLTHGLATAALALTAFAAQAEVTGTVTAVSDYDFRGITQTSQDPALQGSIDFAHDSGFYAGAWASNVDFGDCCDESVEVDLYGGFRGGETVTYDVGLIYYTYPGADDIDYPEIYAGLGWNWLSGKVWYSNDYVNTGDSAMYYEANGAWELPANFGATAHVGYSDGDYWEGSEYTDWSVGVTYALGNFTLGLKYVDGSDLEEFDGTPDDVSSSEARAIFSVSTTFPWSQE